MCKSLYTMKTSFTERGQAKKTTELQISCSTYAFTFATINNDVRVIMPRVQNKFLSLYCKKAVFVCKWLQVINTFLKFWKLQLNAVLKCIMYYYIWSTKIVNFSEYKVVSSSWQVRYIFCRAGLAWGPQGTKQYEAKWQKIHEFVLFYPEYYNTWDSGAWYPYISF